MVSAALPAVLAAWLVQYLDSQFLLAVPAAAWCAAALFAWCLLGGRAAVVVLAVGWTLCRADWQLAGRLPAALAGADLLVSGSVCDFPRMDPEASRFVLERDDQGTAGTIARRLHLSWYEQPPALRPGQRWQLRVRLRPPRGLANPGGFDFEHWLFSRGVTATGYVRVSALNRPLPADPGACPAAVVRERVEARVAAALGERPGAAHVLGMVVGATQRLGEADWELLRATGTTHLLAISGMNIAMVAAPFVLAGPALARVVPGLAGRPALGWVAGLAVGTVYTALAGFATATVRALAMLAVATVLALRRRRAAGPELLASAGLVLLVVDPLSVATASFWLSFAAVAWLFVAADRGAAPARGWRRGLRHARDLALAQAVLGAGLAPLSLGWFQQLSLVAPLANLVAVPVFTAAVMPLALAGAALAWPAPELGGWLLRLAAAVMAVLLSWLEPLAAWSLATWRPPSARWPELLLALGAALLLAWWRPLPWRWTALLLLLPLVAGVRGRPAPLRVLVLDVGQGLAVLVQTPRHALLYDAGPAYRMRDAGESVVVPALRATGVARLDRVVISHDDSDHRGGMAAVLEAFPGARVLAPAGMPRLPAGAGRCVAGLSWRWDDVEFRVLSPGRDGARSDNDGSCVLQVAAAGRVVLLPGDIEAARERRLAAMDALPPASLVLAPHHGSASSSSDAFVGRLRPRFVVFAAGHGNRWGFPAPAVTRRWREAGACALGTAAGGALAFELHDGDFRLVRRERADGAHLWTADVPREPPCMAPDEAPAGLNSHRLNGL